MQNLTSYKNKIKTSIILTSKHETILELQFNYKYRTSISVRVARATYENSKIYFDFVIIILF